MKQRLLSILCGCALVACGSDVATGRRCMAGDARCGAGRGTGGQGVDYGNGNGSDAAIGVGENALRVRVQRPDQPIAIEIITLACAGDCADIEAVASGGSAPYSFEWEDGSIDPARRVCLGASSTLRVHATDTAIDAEEFRYEAQTVSAEVTARVLECEDGGVSSDGAVPDGPLCIENPSFEGTPFNFGVPFDAAPWSDCPDGLVSGSVGNETTYTAYGAYPPATDGATYGMLNTTSGFGGLGVLAQALCEPIPAGQRRSFLIDVARIPESPESEVDAKDAQIQIYGGSGATCAETELLWTSPLLSAEWATQCVTLAPTQTVTSLAFRPLGDGNPLFLGLMSAVLDNIRPADGCE